MLSETLQINFIGSKTGSSKTKQDEEEEAVIGKTCRSNPEILEYRWKLKETDFRDETLRQPLLRPRLLPSPSSPKDSSDGVHLRTRWACSL
uniref:Uncharacterized protein n=1 Tax=Salix viminalis TaxID=40686 RepID=A0A6N2KI53_SALVM